MRWLKKDELLALLEAAKKHSERDWLLILVAYHHGLRASEVIAIKQENIVNGVLYLKRGKRSNPVEHELVEHSEPLLNERAALLAYSSKSSAARPLFPITRQRFWQIVKQHGAAAGLDPKRCFPHAMKHTIAMQIIRPAGFAATQAYLGHKSARSTAEYLKMDARTASEEVRQAMKDR